MTTPDSSAEFHPVSPSDVKRAIRLSYAQAMVGPVYAASTGGMFIIGYALRLGAGNVQIGLMSTIPMLCVVAQIIASVFIERGVSRKSMTIVGAALNVSGWGLVALLPKLMHGAEGNAKIGMLIALIAVVSFFAQISGNARGSWIGDLIPSEQRGTFFGKMTMYGGIIGTVFALLEGAFLDNVKQMGIGAFSWLFVFGMVFGIINTILFRPQADVKLPRHAKTTSFLSLVTAAFANRALVIYTGFAVTWSLTTIAAPFYATYMLRDLRMPFLGVGVVNAAVTVTMLLFAPFWGRMVDKYGCRPIMVAGTLATVPTAVSWYFVTTETLAYAIIVPVNLWQGFWLSGVSVSSATMLYKITPSVGRSVQFALHAVVAVLVASPMPTIGGYIPDWIKAAGIDADLRVTFYLVAIFVLAAGLIARCIPETDATRTGVFLRDLPSRARRLQKREKP